MTPDRLYLDVHWSPRPWWSVYERGTITSDAFEVTHIYRHYDTLQVRLYADYDADGDPLFVNGRYRGLLRKRGRFGRLYIAEDE